MKRCDWVSVNDPLYLRYHDEEWGVPVHDDHKIFEFIILETFQAGLSWKTILYKRENFKVAFSGFDPHKVAAYSAKKIEKLLQDPGIIRNRLKIKAAIQNAVVFLKTADQFGSFDKYFWSFVDGKPIKNKFHNLKEIPARTLLSDKISKDLYQRGFKFVGSIIIYSHMQAIGMVNDHLIHCYRYSQVGK